MDAKIHHIAFVTAREYAKDGYHLVDYIFNEEQKESIYNLVHDNGNFIQVKAKEITNNVEVWKNKKLNKEIKM